MAHIDTSHMIWHVSLNFRLGHPEKEQFNDTYDFTYDYQDYEDNSTEDLLTDFQLAILILTLVVGASIGCTFLVWKFGPLHGNPTWPADLGIFLQCIFLAPVTFVHYFAWRTVVMWNFFILIPCPIIGFAVQLIEETFLSKLWHQF